MRAYSLHRVVREVIAMMVMAIMKKVMVDIATVTAKRMVITKLGKKLKHRRRVTPNSGN